MANIQVCIFNPVTTFIDQITAASTGPAAAGVPIVTNASGLIDTSLLGVGSSAIAGQNLNAGQLVNLYNSGGSLFAQLASAQSTGTAPSTTPYPVTAQGFANTSAFTGTPFTVNFTGIFRYTDGNSEFSASNIGADVYLSAVTPGGVTLTPPSGLQQSVGYVISFTAPNIVSISFIAGFLDFSQINGTVPITKGGTGATAAPQALINLIGGTPSTGQVLTWSGSAWVPMTNSSTPGGAAGDLQINNGSGGVTNAAGINAGDVISDTPLGGNINITSSTASVIIGSVSQSIFLDAANIEMEAAGGSRLTFTDTNNPSFNWSISQ